MDDALLELATEVVAGNAGALVLVQRIVREPDGADLLEHLRDREIVGSQLYRRGRGAGSYEELVLRLRRESSKLD